MFIFDRVFGEDTTQEGVWEYLQDSVNSFLQGYNVSILAYGQSGSGKSYTMGTSGPDEQFHPSMKGKLNLECLWSISLIFIKVSFLEQRSICSTTSTAATPTAGITRA